MGEDQKPALVVMAAGMGSRFKGLKQLAEVDKAGHCLMDYAIYDALEAGFGEIVFIIRHSFSDDFKEKIGNRAEKRTAVTYVYQELTDLPEGCDLPGGRKKPWGTTHAIWTAREELRGKSFLTINADDFYGRDAFREAVRFFQNHREKTAHACVCYPIEKTLESRGFVSRGICQADEDSMLLRIDERKKIQLEDGRGYYTLDDGASFHLIPRGTPASMNLWAMNAGFIEDVEAYFPERMRQGLKDHPDTFEETLSDAVQDLLQRKAGTVQILKTTGEWFGMTYSEDLEKVKDRLAGLVQEGVYPDGEW